MMNEGSSLIREVKDYQRKFIVSVDIYWFLVRRYSIQLTETSASTATFLRGILKILCNVT